MSGGCPHHGRRRRVRSARIEQDRNLQSVRRQHGLAGFLAQSRSRSDARPANENRGAVQIFAAAREDAAMHQIAHRVRLHAAVAQHMLRPGIQRDDAVEDARPLVGVELQQNGRLVAHEWRVASGEWRDKKYPSLATHHSLLLIWAKMDAWRCLSWRGLLQ